MGFLGWIVLGLVAGALAKLIMPGDDPGGILVTMLLGIVGAVVGGFLGSRFFGRGLETFWNLQTWIVAIIGSLILLGLYRRHCCIEAKGVFATLKSGEGRPLRASANHDKPGIRGPAARLVGQ